MRVSDFHAGFLELAGSFTLPRAIDEVFDLFSPLGETLWVPGWSPELLHPPGASWERGLIFRTRDERGDAVWIVANLDRVAHQVECYRVEPERYVVRVSVRCAALDTPATVVHVQYAFVGLSEDGNAQLAGITPASCDETMQQWKRWIDTYFAGSTGSVAR